MKCQHALEHLAERLDPSAAGTPSPELQRHLDECASCRATHVALLSLAERVRDLPASLEPGSDLWPGIEGRIRAQAPTPAVVVPRWLLAASVLVAIGVGALTWWLLAGAEAPSAVSASAAASSTVIDDLAMLARYEDRVLATRKELVQTASLRAAWLDPHVAGQIDASVAAIDVAIGQIRLALERQPDSRSLNQRLAAAYRQEAELLRRLKRI